MKEELSIKYWIEMNRFVNCVKHFMQNILLFALKYFLSNIHLVKELNWYLNSSKSIDSEAKYGQTFCFLEVVKILFRTGAVQKLKIKFK